MFYPVGLLSQSQADVERRSSTVSHKSAATPDAAGGAGGADADEEEDTDFGPSTVIKLTLLENYEKKVLTLFLRARSEVEHLRWFDKLRGKRVTDEGTEYSAFGIRL